MQLLDLTEPFAFPFSAMRTAQPIRGLLLQPGYWYETHRAEPSKATANRLVRNKYLFIWGLFATVHIIQFVLIVC